MESPQVIDLNDHRFKHTRIDDKDKESLGQHYSFLYDDLLHFNLSTGGGGGMNNYITRPEFEEHKRHLDSRFDSISKDITIAKDEIVQKINEDSRAEAKEREKDRKESEKERKSDRKWFISLSVGTGVALLGLVLQIFNII